MRVPSFHSYGDSVWLCLVLGVRTRYRTFFLSLLGVFYQQVVCRELERWAKGWLGRDTTTLHCTHRCMPHLHSTSASFLLLSFFPFSRIMGFFVSSWSRCGFLADMGSVLKQHLRSKYGAAGKECVEEASYRVLCPVYLGDLQSDDAHTYLILASLKDPLAVSANAGAPGPRNPRSSFCFAWLARVSLNPTGQSPRCGTYCFGMSSVRMSRRTTMSRTFVTVGNHTVDVIFATYVSKYAVTVESGLAVLWVYADRDLGSPHRYG